MNITSRDNVAVPFTINEWRENINRYEQLKETVTESSDWPSRLALKACVAKLNLGFQLANYDTTADFEENLSRAKVEAGLSVIPTEVITSDSQLHTVSSSDDESFTSPTVQQKEEIVIQKSSVQKVKSNLDTYSRSELVDFFRELKAAFEQVLSLDKEFQSLSQEKHTIERKYALYGTRKGDASFGSTAKVIFLTLLFYVIGGIIGALLSNVEVIVGAILITVTVIAAPIIAYKIVSPKNNQLSEARAVRTQGKCIS